MKKEMKQRLIEYAVYEMLGSEFRKQVVLTPITEQSLTLYWRECTGTKGAEAQYLAEDMALSYIEGIREELKRIDAAHRTVYISIRLDSETGNRILRFRGRGFDIILTPRVRWRKDIRCEEIAVRYLQGRNLFHRTK